MCINCQSSVLALNLNCKVRFILQLTLFLRAWNEASRQWSGNEASGQQSGNETSMRWSGNEASRALYTILIMIIISNDYLQHTSRCIVAQKLNLHCSLNYFWNKFSIYVERWWRFYTDSVQPSIETMQAMSQAIVKMAALQFLELNGPRF